jgi:hypothetical protein
MSDEETEEPQWEEVKLKPYRGLTEQLKKVRDRLVDVRDRLEDHIEQKETEDE